LYAASGLDNNSMGTSAAIIAMDPTAMTIVGTWNVGVGGLNSMAAAPSGGVYIVSQNITTLYGPYATEFGLVNPNGSYTVLSRWTVAGYYALVIIVSPNGYVYMDDKVYDQNGRLVPQAQLAAIESAWPTSDPWYFYGCSGGNWLFAGNLSTGQVPLTLSTTYAYLSLAAQRQADGTDLVIAARSGAVDFYKVTPPPILYFAANAASNQPGGVAPGSLISVFGQALAPWDSLGTVTNPTKGVMQVGGTQVLVDNAPIPLLYAGYGQVNAQLQGSPPDGKNTLTVEVGSATLTLANWLVIVDQAVAAFMWSPDPANPSATAPIVTNGIVVNGSYQLLGDPAISPAYAQAGAGETVVLWATGIGLTSPALPAGAVLTPMSPLYYAAITPQVAVDGIPCAVAYAGLVPGSVPGLDQINFVVPMELTPGAHDLTLNSLGGTPSSIVYKGGLWTK
jgi:uncharacterized protein (TIGR03437 family)